MGMGASATSTGSWRAYPGSLTPKGKEMELAKEVILKGSWCTDCPSRRCPHSNHRLVSFLKMFPETEQSTFKALLNVVSDDERPCAND